MTDTINTLQNQSFMQMEIFGNSIFGWLVALVIFFVALVILKIFKTIIVVRLKAFAEKSKTEIDDMVIDGINAIHWPFYILVSLYFSLNYLNIHSIVSRWAYYILIIAVTYYAIRFLEKLVDFGAKFIVKKQAKENEHNEGIIKLISATIKVLLWAGAVVLILSNLGYNVTSLIAGLGIGGIAVALALQNILGDLFSSLAIYFDKPFKVGDFVVIGEYMGTVKHVGIKTTRIQALQGEEIVIANSELTTAKLQNFGVMQKRRIVFNVGVTYDTSYEKLQRIPEMVKEIITKQKQVEVDRVHFKTFGDSALIYEIVYYVMSGDYAKYMDTQQAINLAIVEKFEGEKIEMAFPTQTVYVKKD